MTTLSGAWNSWTSVPISKKDGLQYHREGRFLANQGFHPAQQMQQYADGRMQTRLITDAATQRLSVDPQGNKGKKKQGDRVKHCSSFQVSVHLVGRIDRGTAVAQC